MDRDGFIEFVQRTFVERIMAYLRWNVIAQSVHVACINQLAS